MATAIHLVADVKALLGEGPLWSARDSALMWVDIKGRRLFQLGDSGLQEWETPVRVGSIVPRSAGGYIAGADHGLYAVEIEPDEPRFTLLFEPDRDRSSNRFNDGKVDRSGRYWAGTMDDLERDAVGALYRIDSPDSWQRTDDGYRVTNGPAFSPVGDVMYHTDSARRTIFRFSLQADGSLTAKSVFAQFTGAEGYPDGMTVDADGCLWVAFWDGWAVRRFSQIGEQIAMIEVPVQRPTSVAFGGPALDRLFVSSARIGLDEAALSVQPSAGGLFMIEPGCSGIAELPFAG